jgi:hypothetical protein
MHRERTRGRLRKYTERCLNALDLGAVPPQCYVPLGFRHIQTRITIEGNLTSSYPTPGEYAIRIAAADPMGMLLAMMQGQPIPEFEIDDNFVRDKTEVKINWRVADPDTRAWIAVQLANIQKRQKVKKAGDEEYEAMIKDAAEKEDEDAQ